MQGEYQAAVYELKEAMQNDQSFPEPHFLLGRIYQRLGQQDLAQKEIGLYQELKKAQQSAPVNRSAPGPN
jgi:Flp pilus assembly protein TadD